MQVAVERADDGRVARGRRGQPSRPRRPGWQAHLDGEPAEILRANYLFRVIAPPSGRHRVEFVYEPWSVRAGAVGSVFCAVVLLLLGFSRPRPEARGLISSRQGGSPWPC